MCKLLPIARCYCYKSFWLDLYLDMCCFMSQKNLSRCFGIFFFGSFFSHYFSTQHFGLSVHSSDILWKDNSSKGKHFPTSNSSFMLSLHRFEEWILLPTAQSFLLNLLICYLTCLLQSLHDEDYHEWWSSNIFINSDTFSIRQMFKVSWWACLIWF